MYQKGYVRFISVLVPCYNEENYIAQCIESIIAQDYQKDKLEVFIIDGISSDNTRAIIKEYCYSFPYIRLLDNPGRIVSHALNIGVKASTGEVIIRMDVHCTYPKNYLSRLVDYLFALNADNVGGICEVIPAKETSMCKAIAIGMSHKFGVGNSLFRIGTNDIVETDTVPFGCFRRQIFERVGLFDEDLFRNQDDEFNSRIIKNKGRIFLVPDVVIYYYAREKIAKTIKMFYQYGLFKPLVNKKLGSPSTIRQFIPFLFVVGLVIGGLLSFLSQILFMIYIIVILIYILFSLIFSAIEANKYKNLSLFFLVPIIFSAIHISYGWGYIMGIINFNILNKKKSYITTNR